MEKRHELDETDHALLNILRENADRSLAELAEELQQKTSISLHVSNISRRIRWLKAEGYLRFEAVLETASLRPFTGIVLVKISEGAKAKGVAASDFEWLVLNELYSATLMLKTKGAWNYYLEISCRDRDKFLNDVASIREWNEVEFVEALEVTKRRIIPRV